MELTMKGDYYEWYCDWCDSRNLTLNFRINDEKFACSACHRVTNHEPVAPALSSRQPRNYLRTFF